MGAGLALLGVSLIGLGGHAGPPIVHGTTPNEPPPPSWQQDALTAAESYWQTQGHTTPWLAGCQMTVTYAPLPDSTEAGETDDYCNIIISDSESFDPDVLCLDVTHEVGHVMLGPDAFPDNPSDPAHSTDPNNIMYPVIFSQTTPQCTAMLNQIWPPTEWYRKHHRSRKRLPSR